MEEKIITGSVFLLLLVNGLLDWRKGVISLLSLGGFSLLGVGFNFWHPYQSLWEICGGVGIGIGLMLAAFLSREAIGFGDGLLLCVTGLYLGFWANLRLLLTGTICCAVIQGIGVLFRRVRLQDRVPLVPFLFLAFVGGLLL